jgi:hypothetical protein
MGTGKKLNSGTSKGSGDWGEPQEPTGEEGDAMINGAEEGEKHYCYWLEEEGEWGGIIIAETWGHVLSPEIDLVNLG